MHYRGMLRVARRERGIRLYAVHRHGPEPDDADAQIDGMVDAVVNLYAPVTAKGLSLLVRRLRYGAPQWQTKLTAALQRARRRLSHANVDGVEWYWPTGEKLHQLAPQDRVRLLAPFDPIVWDRDRFERLWGWAYRFEAYTPAAKRKLGYYALPMLWRDQVIGWGNLSVKDGSLVSEFGYVAQPPEDQGFHRELAAELDRMREFLEADEIFLT